MELGSRQTEDVGPSHGHLAIIVGITEAWNFERFWPRLRTRLEGRLITHTRSGKPWRPRTFTLTCRTGLSSTFVGTFLLAFIMTSTCGFP